MTETVLVTFLIAKFYGRYKWSQIFKLFKHWSSYPIVATCLLHVYLIYLMIHGEYWFLEYQEYIKFGSLLFYFILIFKYKLIDVSVLKRINNKTSKSLWLVWLTSPVVIGALFTIVGSKLNKIAILYNRNKMPVFPNVSYGIGYSKIDMFEKAVYFKDFHSLGNHLTNVIFLTDIFDFFFAIMSIGDVLLRIFVGLVIYYSIKQSNKRDKNKILELTSC